MQLILDSDDANYQIKAYEPGIITINDNKINHSIILTANTLISPWQPQSLSELQSKHLEAIFALQQDIVILGVGDKWQAVNPEILAAFYQRNIGIEYMDTAAACRTFNVLTSENRRVAAALLIK